MRPTPIDFALPGFRLRCLATCRCCFTDRLWPPARKLRPHWWRSLRCQLKVIPLFRPALLLGRLGRFWRPHWPWEPSRARPRSVPVGRCTWWHVPGAWGRCTSGLRLPLSLWLGALRHHVRAKTAWALMRAPLATHALGFVGLATLASIPHEAHLNAPPVVRELLPIMLWFVLDLLRLAFLRLPARGWLCLECRQWPLTWRGDGDWRRHRFGLREPQSAGRHHFAAPVCIFLDRLRKDCVPRCRRRKAMFRWGGQSTPNAFELLRPHVNVSLVHQVTTLRSEPGCQRPHVLTVVVQALCGDRLQQQEGGAHASEDLEPCFDVRWAWQLSPWPLTHWVQRKRCKGEFPQQPEAMWPVYCVARILMQPAGELRLADLLWARNPGSGHHRTASCRSSTCRWSPEFPTAAPQRPGFDRPLH